MRRLVPWATILIAAVWVLGACESGMDTEELDRRNQEIMASLPVYPGAMLVAKELISDASGRFLSHSFGAPAEGDAVLAFYQQRLSELGWQQECELKDERFVCFVRKDGSAYMDLIVRGQDRLAAGTATVFEVRVMGK